jgi:hypothetical protein
MPDWKLVIACLIVFAAGPVCATESDGYGLIRFINRSGKPFLCLDESVDVTTFMRIRERSSLSPLLTGIEFSGFGAGQGEGTISRRLRQTEYCTLFFARQDRLAAIIDEFGVASVRQEPQVLTRAEYLELERDAKVAGDRAAVFPVALAGCEEKIFAQERDFKRNDLELIEFRGSDGTTFNADRRFQHVPGDRVFLFPASWDHILQALSITYSVPLKQPGSSRSAIFECTVTPRGDPTGMRQIR